MNRNSIKHNILLPLTPFKNLNNMRQTSSGVSWAAAISAKLISGATDNPAPLKEITLFSPISTSTWKN